MAVDTDRDYDFDDDNPRNNEPEGDGGGRIMVAVLAVLFLPAIIIAWAIYYLGLAKGRQKRSVILSGTLTMIVIALMYGSLSDATTRASAALSDVTGIAQNWTEYIPLLVVVSVIIGAVGGFTLTVIQVGRLIKNPYLLHMEGPWKNFTFRPTPLENRRTKKLITQLKDGSLSDKDKAPLGITTKIYEDPEDNKNTGGLKTKATCEVAYRYQADARKNTVMSGGVGSGKTITMLSMIRSDIVHGLPVIMIDMKRDPEVSAKLARWSKENGRNFYHFVNGDPQDYDVPHSAGQASYDPLINGGAAKADMILGMREWDTSSEVYKGNVRQLLQVTFQMLRQADRTRADRIDWRHGGISQLASAIKDNNAFTDLLMACKGRPIYDDAQAVDQGSRHKSGKLYGAMDEVQGYMRTLTASAYGPWLRTGVTDRNIDLYELTKDENSGNVILFSINSDSEKDFAAYLGALIMADISAVSALRRNRGLKNPVNIYIDEFQIIPPTTLGGILEKARASGFATTLASQSLEQVIVKSERNGEANVNNILDTSSHFIIHNGAYFDSATRLAKIVGEAWFPKWSTVNDSKTHFFSFNWNNRRDSIVRNDREQRYIVDPSEFQKLSAPSPSNGFLTEAIIIDKSTVDPRYSGRPRALARKVRMIPDDAVLASYPLSRVGESDYAGQQPDNKDMHLVVDGDITEDQHGDHTWEDDAFQTEPDTQGYDPAGYGDEDEDGGFGWVSDDEEPPQQPADPQGATEPDYSAPATSSPDRSRIDYTTPAHEEPVYNQSEPTTPPEEDYGAGFGWVTDSSDNADKEDPKAVGLPELGF